MCGVVFGKKCLPRAACARAARQRPSCPQKTQVEGQLKPELVDEPGVRVAEHLARRAVEHDAAGAHDDDAVGLERLVHEVGHVDECGARARQSTHHTHDGLAAAHVQKRGRLVEHEHLRLHGQCTGDAHALTLPTAHARRVGARVVGERHAGELAVHAPTDLVAGKAEVFGPEGHVVGHDARHDLVVGVLEHEAEGAAGAAVGRKVGRAALAHALSHELDVPLVRGQKPTDHRGERGLAAAVGAQDAYALAARHLERDVVEGAVVPVAQRNAREAHDGASLEIKVFIEAGAHARPYPASAFETGPCTSAVRAQLRASLRTLNGTRMGRIIATTASTVTAV